MSTDRCNQKVFDKGTCIAMLGDVEKEDVERWCQMTAKLTNSLVDWHYAGGRPRVMALGDINRANVVFAELMAGLPPGAVRVHHEEEY